MCVYPIGSVCMPYSWEHLPSIYPSFVSIYIYTIHTDPSWVCGYGCENADFKRHMAIAMGKPFYDRPFEWFFASEGLQIQTPPDIAEIAVMCSAANMKGTQAEDCFASGNLTLVGGLEHQFYFPINIGFR